MHSNIKYKYSFAIKCIPRYYIIVETNKNKNHMYKNHNNVYLCTNNIYLCLRSISIDFCFKSALFEIYDTTRYCNIKKVPYTRK